MILFLHGAPAYGAVEEYVVRLATGLRERGREVGIVYPDVPALAPFETLADAGVETIAYRAELLSSTPRLVGHLRSTIRSRSPRAAHVTDVWPAGAVAARLAGVRRLFVTHHTPELPRDDNLTGRVWQRLGWLARPTVVYTSETDRRNDRRRLLPTRVVPLGIDVARFADAEPSLPRSTGPLVGNVARLAPQKGQRTIVEAAAIVLRSHPTAQFVFAGEGELRAVLERRTEELGLREHVTFLGHRDDVPGVLASLDVFAFPSRFEGLCLAVIEAQAAGVPVVATPVGGLNETVVPGETGYRTAVDDPASLAAGILRVLEHPEEARMLADEARRRAERYTIARMVAETDALY